VIPLAPLSLSLTAYSRKIAKSHPGIFRRLGEFSHTRFILDPVDLPFVICLDPNGGVPRVTVIRGKGDGAARISGPLAGPLQQLIAFAERRTGVCLTRPEEAGVW
jgi:predicted lipid carrier protein YhbT